MDRGRFPSCHISNLLAALLLFSVTPSSGQEPDPQITFEAEDPLTSGAINAGGMEVDATGELGFVFLEDRPFGTEIDRRGDNETGVVITTNRFGRIYNGSDLIATNPRPIDTSNIPGLPDPAPLTEQLMIELAWSIISVRYRAEVIPGKYEVKLYWAEHILSAVNSFGQAVKLNDVYLNGERVLCNWSAAAAAGSPTGSGKSTELCAGKVDTAVQRTFTINVPEFSDDQGVGQGYGVLDVLIDDLGGGIPPGDAALHALSFERVGDLDGDPPLGDLECNVPPPGSEPDSLLIVEDFEGVPGGECPPGMLCNAFDSVDTDGVPPDTGFAPQAVEGRLRMAEEFNQGIASTAIFEQCVNVSEFRLQAEFDVFMNWDDLDPNPPGDGGTFFVLEGNNTSALGSSGGGLGIPTNHHGFAVEFDTWQGGGNNEPSGFNNTSEAFVHVGINNLSADSAATNIDFDPALKPVDFGGSGWPDFRHPDGVQVKVTYDAGHVEVWLSGFTGDGNPFNGKVAEGDVPPIWTTEAVVGFSGGSSSADQILEFDNVAISAKECTPASSDPILEAMESASRRWKDLGELYINSGGPTLICSAKQNPAPLATGDPDEGDGVVWMGDQETGMEFLGEFFQVFPLDPAPDLSVASTDMGNWDARGTGEGVDDNDRIFHSERNGAVMYEIQVSDEGPWEVTLFFANAFSETAGTSLKAFHVGVEGERKGGFPHCEFKGVTLPGAKIANQFSGFDDLFDPVDAAEQIYSPDPCNFAGCAGNGITPVVDPDNDQIPAGEECGNAAAVALRYEVEVADGALTIALTPPDAGEPSSPSIPKISGIGIRRACEEIPEAPKDLKASAGIQRVTLSWTAAGGDPLPEAYLILRAASGSGSFSPIGNVSSQETSYVDGEVENDREICYKVLAKAAGCVSEDSNVACATPGAVGEDFKRGDVDGNGVLELTDVIRSLNFKFLGNTGIECPDAADVDDNGALELTDDIRSLNFQFAGISGTVPAPPGPLTCGPDENPDTLPPCNYPLERCQ